MARLSIGAETLISIAFLVMCAEKILRLLRLFFIKVLPGSMPGNVLGPAVWCSRAFGSLKWLDSLVAVSMSVRAAYAPLAGSIRIELAVSFFSSP